MLDESSGSAVLDGMNRSHKGLNCPARRVLTPRTILPAQTALSCHPADCWTASLYGHGISSLLTPLFVSNEDNQSVDPTRLQLRQ